MTIIVKNTALTVKNWGGRQYQASSQYTIEQIDRNRLLSDSIFLEDLNSVVAVVNDGSSDLSYANAIAKLRGDAVELKFDNSSNGFTSTNVQAAIEEIQANTESKARFSVSSGFDGNASTGRYLEFNANVDSNIAGFVLARDCHLKELSAVCSANSTITFQIRNKAGTVLTSISLANQRVNYITGLNIALTAGLEVLVYVSSGSCTRPIVWLFIEPD